MKGENVRRLIKKYKGHEIVEEEGLIIVHKDDSDYIVALDDSKSKGPKFINLSNNTVEAAKEYIDWKEKACQKDTTPVSNS